MKQMETDAERAEVLNMFAAEVGVHVDEGAVNFDSFMTERADLYKSAADRCTEIKRKAHHEIPNEDKTEDDWTGFRSITMC